METKRCPRCNKLLRIDVSECTRCGAVVGSRKPTRKPLTDLDDSDSMPSRPTNPPASPHRVGHYSGLHPEDQPFQSSFFLRIQRPAGQEISTDDDDDADDDALLEVEEPDPVAPLTEPHQALLPTTAQPNADVLAEIKALAESPTLYPPRLTPVPEVFLPPRPARRPRRVSTTRILVTAALFCFLVASSLLAFLVLGKNLTSSAHPQLLAAPGELRVGDVLQLSGSGFAANRVIALTRDQNTNLLDAQGQQMLPATSAQGSFQISLPITSAWRIGVHSLEARDGSISASASLTVQTALAGPPHLQLGASHVDLGADNPGALGHKSITLTNSGGGQVSWQAHSSVAWLTLTPTSGSFAGSAVVTLTVNRANLTPQAYLGQVAFAQSGGSTQTLYVSMTVNTTPASMILSTASLAFSGTPVQSPEGQTMVIQNAGGQALNWTATSSTPNDINWLSVTPASGLLNPDTSAVLMVNVNTLKMDTGIFQGSLDFSYSGGATQQVGITLTVNPAPAAIIQSTPQTLAFTTKQGFNPPAQRFTITNSGNATLNWAIQADGNGVAYLNIAPQTGTLAPGQSASVTVTPSLGSAGGTINSTLTIVDSDQGTTVASQQVKVSLAITSEPIITLLTGNIEFDHTSAVTSNAELMIFTNTGSLPLNWSLVPSVKTSWLSLSSSSGTLAPGDFGFVTLSCVSTGMKAGTYTLKLTVKDTDSGTIVAAQSITITLIIT